MGGHDLCVRLPFLFNFYFKFFSPAQSSKRKSRVRNDDTADVGLEFDSSESSSSTKRGREKKKICGKVNTSVECLK